ncbi:hypothetical protein MKW92_013212 [Papaver armeniacum]|nr:hypothetical protein MKW92_013212 [Papaver armeniacum]
MPTLLGNMSEAFKVLADVVNQNQDMEVKAFAQASSSITSLVRLLGPFFTFAVVDVDEKVVDINAASRSFRTLKSMMEADIEQNKVWTASSHSLNLLRLKRIIEMVKILFEQIVATKFEGDNSWASMGLAAYSSVFNDHHARGLQGTLTRYARFIPTQAQFLVQLEEDEATCGRKMKIIVEAASLITQYINNLFLSKGLGLDG